MMTVFETVLSLTGGIGVFLLGMMILTDGLKALAGARISEWLAERTNSPWSGAMTGAIGTAILQSSSATTVAAVGFVSAGLLTFSQSLGIIFGANIGTTVTGWVVALLGFKLNLGSLLLPLIFMGVLLRIFSRGRRAQLGYALAGFGLVFLGIDLLQASAGSDSGTFNLQAFEADSWSVRVKLLLTGMVITLLTQSSSAGVATTLVAIHAGVISFEQGAALVIGMDVGTTVTAGIATIGATASARRTGFSHVVYNCFTAAGAMLLITPFTYLWPRIIGSPVMENPEIVLVAFHTLFNLIGALLVLPLSDRFARLMLIVVPEPPEGDEGLLDRSLLKEPEVAILAVRQVVVGEYLVILESLDHLIDSQSPEVITDLYQKRSVVDDARYFLDHIAISDPDSDEARRLVFLIHTVDHMQRLLKRCSEQERAFFAAHREQLREARQSFDRGLEALIQSFRHQQAGVASDIAEQTWQSIRQLEAEGRDTIYRSVAMGRVDVPYATQCAEALRWLTRVSRHISRICFYLEREKALPSRQSINETV